MANISGNKLQLIDIQMVIHQAFSKAMANLDLEQFFWVFLLKRKVMKDCIANLFIFQISQSIKKYVESEEEFFSLLSTSVQKWCSVE